MVRSAPSDFARASLRSDDEVIATLQPMAFANCRAAIEQPPVPCATIHSPGWVGRNAVKADQLVNAAQVSVAASAYEYPLGAFVNDVAGAVTGVQVDPTDSNVIYITTAGGGAWRRLPEVEGEHLPVVLPEDCVPDGGGNPLNVFTQNGGTVTITGSAFADTLIGSTGTDYLYGAAGNDTMDGGAGIDTLNGGAGLDTFVLSEIGRASCRERVSSPV